MEVVTRVGASTQVPDKVTYIMCTGIILYRVRVLYPGSNEYFIKSILWKTGTRVPGITHSEYVSCCNPGPSSCLET